MKMFVMAMAATFSVKWKMSSGALVARVFVIDTTVMENVKILRKQRVFKIADSILQMGLRISGLTVLLRIPSVNLSPLLVLLKRTW